MTHTHHVRHREASGGELQPRLTGDSPTSVRTNVASTRALSEQKVEPKRLLTESFTVVENFYVWSSAEQP